MIKKYFLAAGFFICSSFVLAQNNSKHKPSSSLLQKTTAVELAKIRTANIRNAAKATFQYFIIKADSATYGYSIYANGNLYIEQKNIPAVAGTKGFADTATAGKCAQLVIQKIKQGEIPPSLTAEELKKNKLITEK